MFRGMLGQNFLIKNSFLHKLEDKMFSFMVTTESDIDDLVEVILTDNFLTLRSKSSVSYTHLTLPTSDLV